MTAAADDEPPITPPPSAFIAWPAGGDAAGGPVAQVLGRARFEIDV